MADPFSGTLFAKAEKMAALGVVTKDELAGLAVFLASPAAAEDHRTGDQHDRRHLRAVRRPGRAHKGVLAAAASRTRHDPPGCKRADAPLTSHLTSLSNRHRGRRPARRPYSCSGPDHSCCRSHRRTRLGREAQRNSAEGAHENQQATGHRTYFLTARRTPTSARPERSPHSHSVRTRTLCARPGRRGADGPDAEVRTTCAAPLHGGDVPRRGVSRQPGQAEVHMLSAALPTAEWGEYR